MTNNSNEIKQKAQKANAIFDGAMLKLKENRKKENKIIEELFAKTDAKKIEKLKEEIKCL